MSEASATEPGRTRLAGFRQRVSASLRRRAGHWGLRLHGLAAIERQVEQIFHAVLGRPPEPQALAAYAGEIAGGRMDFGRAAEALAKLPEAEARFAPQIAPLQTPAEPNLITHGAEEARLAVSLAYRVALGREADPQGLEAYTREIVAGGMTLAEVLERLLTSEEASSPETQGRAVAAMISGLNLEAMVASLYLSILSRDADAEGLGLHVAALSSGHATLSSVIADMLASEEFTASVLRRPEVARAVVIPALSVLTGNEPDPTTVNRYIDALMAGYPVEAFLGELTSERPIKTVPHEDPAGLARELILERLNATGSRIFLPPVEENGLPATPSQVAALLKTLVMLGDELGDHPAAAQRAI